jgi:hypothetical protein
VVDETGNCAHQEALNAVCLVNDAVGHVMLGSAPFHRATAHILEVPSFDLGALLRLMRRQTARAAQVRSVDSKRPIQLSPAMSSLPADRESFGKMTAAMAEQGIPVRPDAGDQQSPLLQLSLLAQDIANAELMSLGTRPDSPGPNPGPAQRLAWKKQIGELATAGISFGVQAGLDYASVRGVIGNVAAACEELLHFGQKICKPEGIFEPVGDGEYLMAGEASQLLNQVRQTANEVLILNVAAQAKGDAARAIHRRDTSAAPDGAASQIINALDPHRILQVIYDLGRGMEAHPRDYRGKNEETLRDHFVANLRSHYPNTTGETFNKSGKTDILIRSGGHTIFVAECKNWSGPKGFHEALDQLLGYLTWRDREVSLILFVRNNQISPVVQSIDAESPKHSSFVEALEMKQDGWFSFIFCHPQDAEVKVRLTVIAFHFPE